MATKVTITGSGHSTYCYVTINGTKYTTAASGITVEAGASFVFAAYGSSGFVSLNGLNVVGTGGSGSKTYTWTVPTALSEISIALDCSSSFLNRYGKVTITTQLALNHRTLVDGVMREIEGGRCLIDGVGYDIRRGRALIDGVTYNVGYEWGFGSYPYLIEVRWDGERQSAIKSSNISETEITASIQGSDFNAEYAGIEYHLYQRGRPYLLPAGAVVGFNFTGTGTGGTEVRVRFSTNINDSHGTLLQAFSRSDSYTVTTPCYMLFLCQVTRDYSASISITDCTVDGERAWAL